MGTPGKWNLNQILLCGGCSQLRPLSGPQDGLGNGVPGARWQEAWFRECLPQTAWSLPALPRICRPRLGQGWALSWLLWLLRAGCGEESTRWGQGRGVEGRPGSSLRFTFCPTLPPNPNVPLLPSPHPSLPPHPAPATNKLLWLQTLPPSPGRPAQLEEHSAVPVLLRYLCVPWPRPTATAFVVPVLIARANT